MFPTMASIHAAMLTCPTIEILKVRAALLGCSEWPDRFNFPFDLKGGERYPSAPLVLSLDGYEPDDSEWDKVQYRPTNSFRWYWFIARLENVWSWASGSRPERWLRWLRYHRLPEEQRRKKNLDLWLDAMDFSRIHTLQLNYTSGHYVLTEQVAQKLPPKLASLESLLVHGSMAEKFILALPHNSLKHLSWTNPWEDEGSLECRHTCLGDSRRSPLKPVLFQTGASLQSLEHRADEGVTCPPPALSLDDLRQLVKLAPNLHTLTINLRRESTGVENDLDWPWERLQLLAEGLPHLTDLTIYYELASECARRRKPPPRSEYDPWEFEDDCTPPKRFSQPLLNQTSATKMAQLLSQHKAGQPLRQVSFKAGDYTPPWDGPLSFSDWWMEDLQHWATCRLDTTTDDGDGGEDHMVCEADVGNENWVDAGDWDDWGHFSSEELLEEELAELPTGELPSVDYL